MNVLFLTSPEPRQTPVSVAEKLPPLGLGFMMALLKRAGHRVHFSDEFLRPTGILETGFLRRHHIDLVGIYANTICYPGTLRLLNTLQAMRDRGEWRGHIAVGGPHTSVAPDTIPAFVDFVVVGEGERAVMDLADGRMPGERIVRGSMVPDLDELPFPAWEDFIHLPTLGPTGSPAKRRGIP
jgi:O-antigen biosynthesis protein